MTTSSLSATGQVVPGNFIKKYYDTPVVNNDNGNNISVTRYADVLLTYAECLNEAGYQPTGAAFIYLNRVGSGRV